MEVETDGSIEPEVAMKNASEILINHFRVVNDVQIPEVSARKEPKAKKKTK